MRKIVRSLTCPSEYSIGVNANLHSPSSLSLSLSSTTFFTSKEKRGDRKQRLRATLGDTFIRRGAGKGYFVCISCRPSSAGYKSTKGESVSTYASIQIPRRRGRKLGNALNFRIELCHLRSVSPEGWGEWKSIPRRNTEYQSPSYLLRSKGFFSFE